ncbi:XRE family transcriptional regulator [Streptomyces chilikensis]|uniref:XRE family transcriptional regulator n=1 Tax=Streptomyces chilikensis TaxID=1194079 RepID=A0ABV3EZI6_9ACTN
MEQASLRLTTLTTEHRQHLAPMLHSLLTQVNNLLEQGRYSPPIGRRLHTLAASLSQATAWHRFDHGLYTDAGTYWTAGLRNAHHCDDRNMSAALLGDIAYQMAWQNNPRSATRILKHALTKTDHPTAQSLLHLRLARALAAQGERSATLRALSAAEHHLGTTSANPAPAWCAWMSQADLAVDSGQALLDLGDTRRAHQLINEGQQLLPSSRNKTRAVFLAYQAKSHLDLREPDSAAATALEALTLSHHIGAPRCVQLVRDLTPHFESHAKVPGVAEVLERTAT